MFGVPIDRPTNVDCDNDSIWEPTDTNIADMLTKCLVGPALTEMCSRVL
jgi:hypothetical protein